VKINNEFLKMIKKSVFLFMMFLALGTAGVAVHAQVTIGSDRAPHPDAVLDLKSNSRGLLLPQVALKGVTDFLETCEYAVYYYVGICFRRFKLCMDCAGGL
jgi:hypothetical protein